MTTYRARGKNSDHVGPKKTSVESSTDTSVILGMFSVEEIAELREALAHSPYIPKYLPKRVQGQKAQVKIPDGQIG